MARETTYTLSLSLSIPAPLDRCGWGSMAQRRRQWRPRRPCPGVVGQAATHRPSAAHALRIPTPLVHQTRRVCHWHLRADGRTRKLSEAPTASTALHQTRHDATSTKTRNDKIGPKRQAAMPTPNASIRYHHVSTRTLRHTRWLLLLRWRRGEALLRSGRRTPTRTPRGAGQGQQATVPFASSVTCQLSKSAVGAWVHHERIQWPMR